MFFFFHIGNTVTLQATLDSYYVSEDESFQGDNFSEKDSTPKKSKEVRNTKPNAKEEKKAKKKAEMAASEDLAKKIFAVYSKEQENGDLKKINRKIEEKDSVICKLENELQDEVHELKLQNIKQKNNARYGWLIAILIVDFPTFFQMSVTGPSQPPSPTAACLRYLRDLVSYYDHDDKTDVNESFNLSDTEEVSSV